MRIDHVQLAIPKGAEQKSRVFWVDVLGMREITKPAALQGRGGAWFKMGATEVHLGVDNGFTPAKKAHPAFEIDGLDDLSARLEDAGFPVTWDGGIAGRRRFFTEDPVGNRVEFLSQA